MTESTPLAEAIQQRLQKYLSRVPHSPDTQASGRLTRIIGLTLEGEGIALPLGQRCLIRNQDGFSVDAEVIGFENDRIFLMSTHPIQKCLPGAEILPLNEQVRVAVGENLLGRVLDGAGDVLDGLGDIEAQEYAELDTDVINPLQRDPICQPMDVGIRAINALLTVGRGQRMGLFAGSGVGKSVLLGMMTKFTEADIVVVGLIGERGREVKEFIDENLGKAGLAKSIVVAAPSNSTPLMRLHGAKRATAIAEYYRDQGKHVLLIIDSLTRFAHAAREIGLARGELPATKGYPPSVFNQLSQLVERAGNLDKDSGSITAFYTVLTENDDPNDPVADSARSFLDGHIVLRRELAESGHYPSIDIEASVSRVLQAVNVPDDLQHIKIFKHLYAYYQQHRDMIRVGAYQSGSDPELDLAINKIHAMNAFLQQNTGEAVTFIESMEALKKLFKITQAEAPIENNVLLAPGNRQATQTHQMSEASPTIPQNAKPIMQYHL